RDTAPPGPPRRSPGPRAGRVRRVPYPPGRVHPARARCAAAVSLDRGLLVEDSRLGDQVAELGPAAAAEGGRQLGYVGAAGADVHAEPPCDRLVHVSFHEELGDGVLDLGDAVGCRLVGGADAEGYRAAPHELEHLAQIAHEAGIAQFEGDLLVVAAGD